MSITVGYQQYQYAVDLHGHPKKAAPTPHLQHILCGKHSHVYCPEFLNHTPTQNMHNNDKDICPLNVNNESSTSTSSISKTDVEIYW